jgi:hypothetical protein
MHQGRHCLFWNPQAKFDRITTNQTLADICNWANDWLSIRGLDEFVGDTRSHYDIANITKLNMWIHDIKTQGIVKPWLLLDQGDGTYLAGTGDSRLRCLERLPEITSVPAFISTTADRAYLYGDLEQVYNFDRFAELCNAKNNQQFLFRLTDAQAPYGIYWYEYNSHCTRWVTPGQDEAVEMFVNYIKQHPNTKFSPQWFDQVIVWEQYKSSN